MEKSKTVNTIYGKIFLIILGAMFISISSQLPLSLPLLPTEVPGTWQTFVVLVFAFITGRDIGFLAVLLYLIAGAAGLPVFAEDSSGIDVLFGKTGGYFLGFLVGAAIVGRLGEQKYWNQKFVGMLLAMFYGTASILIIGTIYLSFFIGFTNGVIYGFTPFLFGATIKTVLGAVFVRFIK